MVDVSVIIVCRNEEAYIERCIDAVTTQFTNNTLSWELIIVDGMSEDKTLARAKEALLKHPETNYSILKNEDKTLAFGWNLGIENSNGKYIIRPDAHAELHSGYIEKAYKVMQDHPSAGAVGGILHTKSSGFWGELIRETLSSKIGVGNSSFRTQAPSGYYDTAVYALYKREVFDNCGLFNTQLIRHQDTDFHERMTRAGYKFWMENTISADYYCRNTVKGINKQMFQIGLYMADLASVGTTGSIQLRHLAPLGFYLGIFFLFIISLTIIPTYPNFGLLVFLAYLTIIFLTSLRIMFKKNSLGIKTLLMTLLIPSMHFSYACGTLKGFLKMIVNKFKK